MMINHSDFIRLSALAEGVDTSTGDVDTEDRDEVHAAIDALLGPLADVESVSAVAADRTDSIVESVPELLLLHPRAMLRSVWMDGFTLGVLFQQRGGHSA